MPWWQKVSYWNGKNELWCKINLKLEPYSKLWFLHWQNRSCNHPSPCVTTRITKVCEMPSMCQTLPYCSCCITFPSWLLLFIATLQPRPSPHICPLSKNNQFILLNFLKFFLFNSNLVAKSVDPGGSYPVHLFFIIKCRGREAYKKCSVTPFQCESQQHVYYC